MGGLVVARRQGYATPYPGGVKAGSSTTARGVSPTNRPPPPAPTHLTCPWAQAGGIAAPVQIRASRGCHRSWHRFNRCGQPTHLRHHGAEVVDAPARCHRSLAGARTHKDQRSTEQEVEAVPPGCPPELAAPGLEVEHGTAISAEGQESSSSAKPARQRRNRPLDVRWMSPQMYEAVVVHATRPICPLNIPRVVERPSCAQALGLLWQQQQ